MRYGKIIAAFIFVFTVLLLYNSKNAKTSTNNRLSSYITTAQEHFLKQIFQQQHSVLERQMNDNSTAEMIKLMKQVRHQLKSVNNTLMTLKEWSEYKTYRATLERTLYDTFNPKNITKTNPHVLLSDVDVNCNTNYNVIFLVTSFAKHFDRRKLIRNMWGNHTMWMNKMRWKVIFNVGTVKIDAGPTHQQLRLESKKYRDLFMVDTEESFYLLSKKVMIALHWVYQSFQFDFIFKVDDDVFIQVDRLMKTLTNDWKHEDFIGHAMRGQPVERKGRYGVSLKEWPRNIYDPYCSGGGYILSQNIIGRMIPFFNWQNPLKIDDAYIGHLVKLAGSRPLHAPNHFAMWNDRCRYLPLMVVTHPGKTFECQDFMMKKSLIEMGRLEDDALRQTEAFYEKKTKKIENVTTRKQEKLSTTEMITKMASQQIPKHNATKN